MEQIYIFGAGGLGQEILDTLYFLKYEPIGFIDDFNNDSYYEGLPIVKLEDKNIKDFCNSGGKVIIGIGDPNTREKIYCRLKSLGANLPAIVDPFAYVGMKTTLGEGSFIGRNVTITTNITIGTGTYININSTIGHMTKIGSFCHIAPGVNISGDCIIGNKVYFGTGSKIIEKKNIGDNVIIGAGAVVIKSMPNNVMVAGVPAIIKKTLNDSLL